MRRLPKNLLVAGLTAGLFTGSFVMTVPAEASSVGDAVAHQATGQYTSQNPEVHKRKHEGGKNQNNNCNFYSGFWNKGAVAGTDHNDHTHCGTSKGYKYVHGVKKWTDIQWRSQAWCADFAKFTWYWAQADVSGIGSAARDFKAYGQDKKHRTWHERAEVASGRYTPKPGDVVSYDWKMDGTIDHVGVVISYDARTKTFTSIEGNSSDQLNKKKTVSAVLRSSGVVGFTAPVAK